jgi:hypothetical protein
MKKVLLLLSVCLLFAVKGYSQFAFGVAPGLSTNTAYFGFKAGKVVPYVGFQYANIKFTNEWESHTYEYDGDIGDYVWVDDDGDMKISGSLYVPNIGVKFFAIEQNKLKAYFNLSVSKPFIRGKMQVDGDDAEFDFNGDDDATVNDILKEIKLIGGEFGFGVEYFFDNNFSIGGEFGLRYLRGKFTMEDEGAEIDDDVETYTDTYKISMSPTYSKISLNFYFGGSGE